MYVQYTCPNTHLMTTALHHVCRHTQHLTEIMYTQVYRQNSPWCCPSSQCSLWWFLWTRRGPPCTAGGGVDWPCPPLRTASPERGTHSCSPLPRCSRWLCSCFPLHWQWQDLINREWYHINSLVACCVGGSKGKCVHIRNMNTLPLMWTYIRMCVHSSWLEKRVVWLDDILWMTSYG